MQTNLSAIAGKSVNRDPKRLPGITLQIATARKQREIRPHGQPKAMIFAAMDHWADGMV
jgi:hypothetical protein